MQISHIRIKNFKGFESCNITLHPSLNLLVGDNATGKTSVLNALAIGIGSWFLGMAGIEKPLGIDADAIRLVPHFFPDSIDFEEQPPSRIECTALVMGETITWARELGKRGGRTTSVEARQITAAAESALKSVRAGETVALPLICTYGTQRLWFEKGRRLRSKAQASRRLPSRLDGYRDCLNSTIQETDLLHWFRDQSTAMLPDRRDTIALELVKHAIISCADDATGLYYDGRYRDVVVQTKLRGSQLLRNLSDGQRIMFTLAGDLARRIAILNPHFGSEALRKTSGVVLIDELDLHLHPKWQRRVIADLRCTFPALQFIATTHSPQLIGEAHPSEITLLDEFGASSPPRSFGIDSNRILEEVMGAAPRNLNAQNLLARLNRSIDEESFDHARLLLDELSTQLGPDDPEVTRAHAQIHFLESPL